MLEVCLWMMRRRIPAACSGLLARDHLDVAAHSHFWRDLGEAADAEPGLDRARISLLR
jgi:hypothetical protein